MKLITEDVVKRIINAGKKVVDGELLLPADCLVTPAAMDVITNAHLKLNQGGDKDGDKGTVPMSPSPLSPSPEEGDRGTVPLSPLSPVEPATGRYKVLGDGFLDIKPEHLTQLHNNVLVPKDDPRIHLRGKTDLLIAEMLKVQVRAHAEGAQQLVNDLEDVYSFVGNLSRCEALDEPLSVSTVIGLGFDEIREVSHHPKRYFGRGHLFNISYRDGEFTVLLNGLRALSRQCELTFYEAFKQDDSSVARSDLMEGYNRLSSVFYILCLRAVSGWYGEIR